uniref:BPI2 domain-containing protein n=1 Tax=Globodera rostochiensis TaxID=31243 RepID=A0A914HKU8_GLORO
MRLKHCRPNNIAVRSLVLVFGLNAPGLTNNTAGGIFLSKMPRLNAKLKVLDGLPSLSLFLSLSLCLLTVFPNFGICKPEHSPYETVLIDDPAGKSAGIYFRISQRGVDYLAELASEGLPDILHRMVLPTIRESSFTLSNAVITGLKKPQIGVKFVAEHGVDLSVYLPELSVRGSAEISVFFTSYSAQMLAILGNFTVNMRVNIYRNLNESATSVTVTECTVDPGNFIMKYFGPEASQFYAITDLISSGIDTAIRDKICILPPLIREFVQEKIQIVSRPTSFLSSPSPSSSSSTSAATSDDDAAPSVFDHLCSPPAKEERLKTDESVEDVPSVDESPEVDLEMLNGTWMPDLTLRYPPTFSKSDLIFGIDGGILYNGKSSSPASVERPKFEDIEVRDQMLGLILSEYVPNTFFWHIFNAQLGHVSVSYSHRHVPYFLRSIVKMACADCRLVIALVDVNGVVLALEGDVSAVFRRKNKVHNLLSASGQLRVLIKPHFRHSRLYSDVLLTGVDFKMYKGGMDGLMAGAIRKMVSFLIPRAIWPKIQQRLRLVVNYKGVQIPRLCSVELNHLHLDYIPHAAIISGDFDVDLPLLIRSFKEFMDVKQRRTKTRRELITQFRYL